MNSLHVKEQNQLINTKTDFRVGDTVQVSFQIVEGRTERIQIFEGLVIARNNSGVSASFTVRKLSFGIGVEKIFPLQSPRIKGIVVVRRGKVRRAKLYYIRDRIGKSAQVKEQIKRKKQ